jgi:hypothetical protein
VIEEGQSLDQAQDGDDEGGDHDHGDRDAPVPHGQRGDDEDDDQDSRVVLGLRRLDWHD